MLQCSISKTRLKIELIEPDKGFAYQYQINSNFLVSSSDSSLLYENGLILTRTGSERDVRDVRGKFVFHETDDEVILYFSTSDGSDPQTNQREYVIFHHIPFFSRPMGFFYLFIGTMGLLWFGIIMAKPPKRKQIIQAIGLPKIKRTTFTLAHWKNLSIITIIAIYVFVFMEWLFFATKPSFMEIIGWWEKFEIYLLASFFLSVISIAILGLFAGLDFLFSRRKIATFLPFFALILPSLILSLLRVNDG